MYLMVNNLERRLWESSCSVAVALIQKYQLASQTCTSKRNRPKANVKKCSRANFPQRIAFDRMSSDLKCSFERQRGKEKIFQITKIAILIRKRKKENYPDNVE